MTISYMARQKREVTAKSMRFITEVSEALDRYADDQLISLNAAVNKLLRDKLAELGYLENPLKKD